MKESGVVMYDVLLMIIVLKIILIKFMPRLVAYNQINHSKYKVLTCLIRPVIKNTPNNGRYKTLWRIHYPQTY